MAEEFMAGVKGVGYTPGKAGFQDLVYPGKRAIFGNMVKNFKAGQVADYIDDITSQGTSYWWNINAGSYAKADIYDIAMRINTVCKRKQR
jgi:hypothetical protein